MRLTIYIWLMFFFAVTQSALGQTTPTSAEYLKRAEDIYGKVWRYYRVPTYGLFSENYPSNQKDTLTYLQGSGVQEKEVSFLWPFSGIVSATNVLLKIPAVKKRYVPYLDSLVSGLEKYRDTTRLPIGYQAYPGQFEKADRYYDDNGLVAIDYAEAYLNTKNPVYLERAKSVFKFIVSGWDNQLGGGVYWLEGHKDMKPACTNGMAALAALKIYKGTKDRFYLQWGEKFYNWMHDNLRDSAGVYWNDKKIDGTVNKTTWTYNSGSMLEASLLLYEFTKKPQYLEEAKTIANGAFNHFTAANKNPALKLHIDLPWFVTVLFRGYEALYKVDGNYQYIAAIEHDLNYAWQNARDKNGFITLSWSPKPQELEKPKRLLDEACIAELYARLSIVKQQRKKQN